MYLSVLSVLVRILLSWVLGFKGVMTCTLACSIKKSLINLRRDSRFMHLDA